MAAIERAAMDRAATTGSPAVTRAHAEIATSTFEAAVAPHHANLVRRLVMVLGNVPDAEDVAQEAYLAAFRAWGRFDGADVRAWLYTIGLRKAFNHLRGRRRFLAAVRRVEPTPWDDAIDPDLWAALRTLEIRPRTALLLSAIDGYTQAEIATILDVPSGTVASWIARSRTALREVLERA